MLTHPGQAGVYDGNAGQLPAHKRHFYRDILDSRVLDIGCGAGQAGAYLRQAGNRLDGITWSAKEAELARASYHRLEVMDINDITEFSRFDERYEVILLGDILEHLAYPAAVLEAIIPLLAPQGRIYISVPNVANITVRTSLLLGRFDYADDGILDATHLRFFTMRSLQAMLDQVGLITLRHEWSCWNWNILPKRLLVLLRLAILHERLKKRLTRMFPGLFATQLMVVTTLHSHGSERPE